MRPLSKNKKIFYKIANDLYLYNKKYNEIRFIERTFYEIILMRENIIIFAHRNNIIIFYKRKYIFSRIYRNASPTAEYKKYREILPLFTIREHESMKDDEMNVDSVFLYSNFVIINNIFIINIDNLTMLNNIRARINTILDLKCLKITYKNISKLFYKRIEIPNKKIRKPFIKDILSASNENVKLLYLKKEQFDLKAVAILFLQQPDFIYRYEDILKLFISRSNGDCKKIFIGLERLYQLMIGHNGQYDMERPKEKIFYLNSITKEFISPYIHNRFLKIKRFFSERDSCRFDQFLCRTDVLFKELKALLLNNSLNVSTDDDELIMKKRQFNNNRMMACLGEALYYFATGLTVNRASSKGEKNFSEEYIMNNHEFLCAMAECINNSVNLSNANHMAIMAYGIRGNLKQFDVLFSTYLFNKNNIHKNSNLIAFAFSYKNTRNEDLIKIADQFLKSKKLLEKQAGIFSLGLLNSAEHENRLLKELLRKDIYRNNSYNEFFMADIHYLISAISISLITSQNLVYSQNTFCELLINGIRFFNSNNEQVKYSLRKSEREEGNFYYSLLYNTVDFQLSVDDAVIVIEKFLNKNKGNEYSAGGLAFYVGLKITLENSSKKHFKKILKLTLLAEKISNLVFEYLLLSLTLISSNNLKLNINVIRIIRRKILEGERAITFESKTYFIVDDSGGHEETIHTLPYGKIEKYKLMAGILLMGGSKMRFDTTSKYFIGALISAFYVCDNITYKEQLNNQYIKYLIYLPIEAKMNIDILKNGEFTIKNINEKDIFKYNDIKFTSVRKYENLIYKLKRKKIEEKKILLDLLSEYYENNSKKYNSLVKREYVNLPF